ncbi:MAG: BREX-1 system phosphatase PglZ type A [Desulfohalobiaceae bacterium]|nr:BREX-1 system phosphatase PglZ type A [Desulfohalobiaceae bacterium]
MNTQQITDNLNNIFHTEDQAIVFWHDPDQEFSDLVPELDLDGVKTINLQDESLLELKVRLELEDSGGKYLLYAPSPEPDPDQDWLLDIRLYSRSFHADRASILLSELGLSHQSMRAHLNEHKNFFKNQNRLNRLKKLVDQDDRERGLDLKMMAVLTRADQAGIFDILMKLFGQLCSEEGCDFKVPPRSWAEIEKFGLASFFWEEMTRTFNYTAETPSLADLLIRLLVTDLTVTIKGDVPKSLQHFVLPERSPTTNVSVFLAQWRSHLAHFRQYSKVTRAVAKEVKLDEHLLGFDAEALIDCLTFEAVERQVIRSLRDKAVQDELEKPEELKPVILNRKDGHWATVQLEAGDRGRNIYAAAFDALEATLDLFLLRRTYDPGLSYPSPERLVQAYTTELFRFDQLYRLFHEAADRVELAGWDVLKEVQKKVESIYSSWFLDQLSLYWGAFLEGEDGLLKRWSIPDIPQDKQHIPNQDRFYQNHLKLILEANPKNKVYVIISDGLRYEIAEELKRTINSKFRFKARLDTQLGVLPSYTALGMAALLPHQEYGFKEGSEQILVDGLPCASLEQRNEILSRYQGTAIRAEDLLAMNKEQGRDRVRPHRVIYIYHNQIDSTGDTAQTEGKTFAACKTAIDELSSLVRFIVNSLNGTNVFVTADHGFLYQDSPPTPLEKSKLEIKPENAVKTTKRFLLGKDLGQSPLAWHSNTRITAGTIDDMGFWIPKGANRFHFAGGARFIHGGALPQEILVPVIMVKELAGKAAKQEAVQQVGVSLLGSNRKIVNSIQKFELIQTEKVAERRLPRTLVVSVRDGDTLISNETTVTFDSDSDSMEDRKRSVKILLTKGDYDNKKEYALVLRDPETQIEYDRVPVTIDLAFMNDF